MGQKVHPTGFRLGISQDYSSTWFSLPKLYSQNVREDIGIRKLFQIFLIKAGITDIKIERHDENITVNLFVTHPRIVANFQFESIKPLLIKENLPITMQVLFVYVVTPNAVIIANKIAVQLEKRIPFRNVLRKAIQETRNSHGIKGLKVKISGRLNGAEIARSEWSREGRVPLHTLKAGITYCSRPARTIYGVLGIKVWLYNGN